MEEKGEFWTAKANFGAAVKIMLMEVKDEQLCDSLCRVFAGEITSDLSREFPDGDLQELARELTQDSDKLIEILLKATETVFQGRNML